MTILCTIDLLTREVSLPANQRIAAYDHNVDVIHFQAEPIEDFSLDLSSIKVAAKGPNKVRHDYAVDPSTVAIEEETGYITFDWPIPQGVTEMPEDMFGYGATGQLIFAVCAEIISGDTVSKAWHSDDGIITVVAHLEPESGGGEDPSETATNAQKIAQLQTATAILQREISGIASGTPPTADSTDDMDHEVSTVYINTTDGNWYYWNGSAWTSGGTYGGAATDTTLSISGAPADAKAVGEALAEKADADDVGELSQLTTTAKDNLVAAINEANEAVTGINGRLDKNVSDLKSALNQIPSPQTGTTPITTLWENGAINNGQNATGVYNRRTVSYIPVYSWATFVSHNSSNGTVYAYINEYDENHTFLGNHNSARADLSPQYENCKYVRIMTFSESVAVAEQDSYMSLEYVTVNPHDEQIETFDTKLSTATAENGETTPISLTWETGHIRDGQDVATTTNRRTVGYIPVYEWTTFVSHNSSNGTVTAYLIEYDANYSYLGYHLSPRADLSPQYDNCAFVRLSIYSTTVEGAAKDAFISAEYITINETADNMHQLESSLNLLTEPSVLYMTDRLEVGATKNNDSGNTTYIYKSVVNTTLDEYKVIGIKCSKVKVKGKRNIAFVIYERNASNTKTDTNVTINDALRGFILKPKADTVSIVINFYPSIDGGLVDEYAFVEGLVIVANNDGRFAVNGYSYADRFALPPYYYKNNYIDGKIDVIATLMKNADSDCDTFMFCTDQHWILNAQNSPKLMKYINERIPIPRIFMGGDYADGINTYAYNAYREAFNGKIYNVFGNHEYMSYYTDQNKTGASKTITGADVWTYMNNGIADAVEGVASRGYYYVDNPMKKMRYIILSVFDKIDGTVVLSFENEQLDWFTNVALDMPNGYTAVVFGHYFANQPYGTDTVVKPNDFTTLFSVVDENKSKIACLIAGHTHVDLVTETDGGVPIFVTTCDKYLPWIENGVDREPNLTEYRKVGTITEQAFDVVVIDKKNRLISFVRIGAAADNGTGERLELRQRAY